MKAAAPLAKNILAPLGITVAELNYYSRIKKKYMFLELQYW